MWSYHYWRGSSMTEWYQVEMKNSWLKLTQSRAELRCWWTDKIALKNVRSLDSILWLRAQNFNQLWIIHSKVSQNGNLEQKYLLLLVIPAGIHIIHMMMWLWLLSVLLTGDICRYIPICTEYCKYLLNHHTVLTLHTVFREHWITYKVLGHTTKILYSGKLKGLPWFS